MLNLARRYAIFGQSNHYWSVNKFNAGCKDQERGQGNLRLWYHITETFREIIRCCFFMERICLITPRVLFYLLLQIGWGFRKLGQFAFHSNQTYFHSCGKVLKKLLLTRAIRVPGCPKVWKGCNSADEESDEHHFVFHLWFVNICSEHKPPDVDKWSRKLMKQLKASHISCPPANYHIHNF